MPTTIRASPSFSTTDQRAEIQSGIGGESGLLCGSNRSAKKIRHIPKRTNQLAVFIEWSKLLEKSLESCWESQWKIVLTCCGLSFSSRLLSAATSPAFVCSPFFRLSSRLLSVIAHSNYGINGARCLSDS